MIKANGLFWAGRQKRGFGRLVVHLDRKGGAIEWSIKAEHIEPIKGVGTLIRGLKAGKVLNRLWQFEELNLRDERVLTYPRAREGDIGLVTPLFFIQHHSNGPYTFVQSLDTEVRCKRFVVMRDDQGNLNLELHHEEDARRFDTRIVTPVWRIGRCDDCRAIVRERMLLMERIWGLKPWEERPDVPEWARHIALVVNLHGVHWTGYVFNTFDRQLEILRWLAQRIEGRYILAYLPGWDGRYYYNYPLYEADPDLGGSEGLKRLVNGAHSLGIHVVPMFGAIGGNTKYLRKLGLEDVIVQEMYGNRLLADWPTEWDNDRERDDIWVPCNPGHPKFRQYLFKRICHTVDEYGVDGVFLDINHYWVNDPRYNICEGMRNLAGKLHDRYERFLIFGEGWYDAMLGITPLVHDHRLRLRQWPEFFQRYARVTYHLSYPCPGRGSTGVHERGFSEFKVPDPNEDVIPTLGVVDDTLPSHREQVEKVIDAAFAFAKRKHL